MVILRLYICTLVWLAALSVAATCRNLVYDRENGQEEVSGDFTFLCMYRSVDS